MGQIDSFIQQVRQRLTIRRSIRAVLGALLVGSIALLIVAAVYALQGYSVPRFWYSGTALVCLLAAIVIAMKRRATPAEATQYADEHFHLKDAVTSAKRFELQQKSGGFYDLQHAATQQATTGLDASAVSTRPPSKFAAAAGALALAAGLTAFISPSKAVLDRIALEEQTEKRSEEVIEELTKQVEELQKSLDGEEKELVNAAELQKWVEQLKSTKDQKDAMRQLAELERKLNEAAKNLALQRKDEQLLKKAGEELQKEEDPEARELGKKLEQEKFKQAAEKLKEMKDGEKKDGEKPQKKTMDEKKKELAKLKAAAKRMASAARQQKQKKNSKENGEERENSGDQDQNLEDLMEEMDEDANKMDEAMEEGDMEKCELCEGKLGEKLDKLGKKLGRMDAKKSAQSKLLGLNKKLGQCQSYCQGKGQGLAQMPGGLKPGEGTDNSRRKEKDAFTDNGQTTQIKGQKDGQGPTLSQIESADDGTGTSHRKAEAKQRNFSKQFESFVQREDVPDDVKEGVKNYFKAVHDPAVQPAPAEAETTAPAPAKP